jgi:hypothetical protein
MRTVTHPPLDINMTGNSRFFRQVVVPLVTVLTITANVAIDAVRLNGTSTAEISDRFENLFVPAGYVFAIWGVIYIALIAFSIFQALPQTLTNPRLGTIAPLYVLGSAANVLWLTLFHYEQFGLAMGMIVVLLVSLIASYAQLDRDAFSITAAERWFVRLPLSIYLGWVSVATIANATQYLVYLKWDGFGIAPETWAIAMISVATLLGLILFIKRRDTAYLLVLAWAFGGIASKQQALPALAGSAWAALGVMLLLAAIALFVRRPALTSTAKSMRIQVCHQTFFRPIRLHSDVVEANQPKECLASGLAQHGSAFDIHRHRRWASIQEGANTMEISIHAAVQCIDGADGIVDRIVVDPVAKVITHIVVREAGLLGNIVMVPMSVVTKSTTETLHVDLTKHQLSNLQTFVEKNHVTTSVGATPMSQLGYSMNPVGVTYWPFYPIQEQDYIRIDSTLPKGELAMHRRDLVQATDGHVGYIDEFMVDPRSDAITHLVLREGHLWGQRHVAIPVSHIERISDGEVLLKVTKQQIEALPALQLAWVAA